MYVLLVFVPGDDRVSYVNLNGSQTHPQFVSESLSPVVERGRHLASIYPRPDTYYAIVMADSLIDRWLLNVRGGRSVEPALLSHFRRGHERWYQSLIRGEDIVSSFIYNGYVLGGDDELVDDELADDEEYDYTNEECPNECCERHSVYTDGQTFTCTENGYDYFRCQACEEFYGGRWGPHIYRTPSGEVWCGDCFYESYSYCEGCGYAVAYEHFLYYENDCCDYCESCYSERHSTENPENYCHTCNSNDDHLDELTEMYVCDCKARRLIDLRKPVHLAHPLPALVAA